MRPYTLLYLYRKRLRAHAAQEMLAGLGVATAVALVFATLVASRSVESSTEKIVHAVVGSASLQLRARNAEGFDEHVLKRVEAIAGVEQAAPLLEETATLFTRHGRRATVEIAGTNISLAILNGLAHTLPLGTLSPGGIGLSRASADALGLASPSLAPGQINGTDEVSLRLRGSATTLSVSAVLGAETFGALSRAQVAVMPLERLQQLAGLPGRISRVLVQTRPAQEESVRKALQALAGGRLTVAPAAQDALLLHQALGPSNQASALFAAISALLGFLFAFNAMLLTVPERRRAIADLRIDGTRRTAIVQMVIFQALCLGLVASLLGMLGGYALALGAFHQTPGYLAHAFTLGTSTVVGVQPLLAACSGGILATCLASTIPLLDLRRGHALDAVDREQDEPPHALGSGTQRRLLAAAAALLLVSFALFVLMPSAAIAACVLLALATLLAVPLTLACVLRGAGVVARRFQRLTILPVALASLQATALRSLALAATGALALFGSVALGGSRDDLLRGIDGYTSNYVAGADIWVINPGDNQATNDFSADPRAQRIASLPGVAGVQTFQGSFLDLADRRVWVIAWPPSARLSLLDNQIIAGDRATAIARLHEHGWIAVSRQIASEHHVGVGDTLALPTPTGTTPFRIAATTTNFGWSPGAILLNTVDYGRAWGTSSQSALGVDIAAAASLPAVRREIEQSGGPSGGLEVLSANARERNIDASASEGLSQLGEISTLLVIAAILAMTAALGSSIWEQRRALAGLRLEGTRPKRLSWLLLTEAMLLLGAGCLAGAIAGVLGQVIIDGYLRQVTGFPVATVATGLRPLEMAGLVLATVLAVMAIPGWVASSASPALALEDE